MPSIVHMVKRKGKSWIHTFFKKKSCIFSAERNPHANHIINLSFLSASVPVLRLFSYRKSEHCKIYMPDVYKHDVALTDVVYFINICWLSIMDSNNGNQVTLAPHTLFHLGAVIYLWFLLLLPFSSSLCCCYGTGVKPDEDRKVVVYIAKFPDHFELPRAVSYLASCYSELIPGSRSSSSGQENLIYRHIYSSNVQSPNGWHNTKYIHIYLLFVYLIEFLTHPSLKAQGWLQQNINNN